MGSHMEEHPAGIVLYICCPGKYTVSGDGIPNVIKVIISYLVLFFAKRLKHARCCEYLILICIVFIK